jgi:predicted extracellular nuclease
MPAVRSRSFFARLLLAAASVLAVALPAAAPTFAVSNDVVISQVYGGGGNTSATLTNDFIELFNRGAASVDLTGWTVQYASSAGTSWQRTILSGSVAPGHYYLVQEGAGTGGTTALPASDASGGIAMSATSGKVALVTNSTLLACGTTVSCVTTAGVHDFVGFGAAAANFEGSGPTATLSNTTAALRAGDGCTDTDNNASDFSVGAPNPRNTAFPSHACGGPTPPTVVSTSPSTGAGDVSGASNISITFSRAVTPSGNWFAITCSTSGAHDAAQSGGPVTFTLDPAVDFSSGETCTLTIHGAQVADAGDPSLTVGSDVVVAFSTQGLPARIHDVQGAGHISPLVNQRVSGVTGIVTGLRSNGFYFQDPNPDPDLATSEGVFVFTSSTPGVVVGDALSVSGTVQEFRPGGAASNLTVTELSSPAITVQSHNNALPAPTVIGQGGRVPPTAIIEDDAISGNVETSGVFDSASDGIDFYESLEGMRVQINNAVVVGPTNSFNEIPVLADNGADASVRTARGGILARRKDFNPERMIVDDEILKATGGTFPVGLNVRDTFTAPLVGVVDYDFGDFMIELTQSPTAVAHNLPKETTTSGIPNQLKIATFNVENLDPSDGPAKFNALAALIVKNLNAPDLVALEEVQDSNGAVDDGTVDPSVTMQTLIAAIRSAGGPAYDYRQINPLNDTNGGEPGGNIRVVFMFRTDRGLSFVDRAGGSPTTAVGVADGANGPQLTSSPSLIDPTNAAFVDSRKPLVGEFLYNGHHLFVVGNHFNSKGGDDPLFGRFQPPTLSSEVQRHQQAQLVHDFVGSILSHDADADIVVLGDLNDFDFSQTLTILRNGVLNELMDALPVNERYTYDFEGNSQALDHMLASNHLVQTTSPDYDIVHVNAEFADQASDHDPQLTKFTLPSFDSVRALVHLYSTSSSVTDSLVADLTTAETNAAQKDAALADFQSTVNAEIGHALTWNQADILLRLIGYL